MDFYVTGEILYLDDIEEFVIGQDLVIKRANDQQRKFIQKIRIPRMEITHDMNLNPYECTRIDNLDGSSNFIHITDVSKQHYFVIEHLNQISDEEKTEHLRALKISNLLWLLGLTYIHTGRFDDKGAWFSVISPIQKKYANLFNSRGAGTSYQITKLNNSNVEAYTNCYILIKSLLHKTEKTSDIESFFKDYEELLSNNYLPEKKIAEEIGILESLIVSKQPHRIKEEIIQKVPKLIDEATMSRGMLEIFKKKIDTRLLLRTLYKIRSGTVHNDKQSKCDLSFLKIKGQPNTDQRKKMYQLEQMCDFMLRHILLELLKNPEKIILIKTEKIVSEKSKLRRVINKLLMHLKQNQQRNKG